MYILLDLGLCILLVICMSKTSVFPNWILKIDIMTNVMRHGYIYKGVVIRVLFGRNKTDDMQINTIQTNEEHCTDRFMKNIREKVGTLQIQNLSNHDISSCCWGKPLQHNWLTKNPLISWVNEQSKLLDKIIIESTW